ncbi:DUF3618 domain-containing protein [Rhodovulum sp. 12E13]|uniref:DUF3618 domain-containing protein n=1 Tax=Rhodovulum sp. 12E13 TaxID=2203891 RepID=UPI000E1A2227|nr:DUF3618 domain-containing protein [Rhodovulum sp. 12E13]RDC69921.1 DUF3618 domain-containing protein [Rhodovulum sp. 12E13]
MTDGRRERPDEIERDIEARRDDLAATLDALQDRASPRGLAEGVGHALKDEGGEMLDAAIRVARRNPVAVAMIAAGVAWLAFGPDTAGPQDRRRRDPAERPRAHARAPAAQPAGKRPRGPVPGGTAHASRPLAGDRSDRAPARLTPAATER